MRDAPTPARRPVEDRPVRIVSARPSLGRRFQAIWHSRELLSYFVVTDIKIKYKSSALGLLWSLIAPAMTLGIYFVVFGIILGNRMPDFAIFLFSGLVVWNFFAAIVSASTGIIVDRAAVVKKVAFPREILALSIVGTSLIIFMMQAIVLLLFMLIVRHAPDWGLIWLLPIALLAIALIAGALGIFLSAVNVYLRDTKHLIEVVLQLWFFLTPIIYSFEQQLSLKLHAHGLVWLYLMNPVAPIVMTFQRVIYARQVVTIAGPPRQLLKTLPTWPVTTYLAMDLALVGLGLLALVFAVFVFGRLEGNFAEEL